MTKLYALWQSAWRLRLYIAAAVAVALLIAIIGSLLVNTQRQNQADARRDADEAALRAAIARIAIDEDTISQLVDQNRNAINNNSAQVGKSKLDISDLRALVEQAKIEVIHQLDGLAAISPSATANTVAAKLIAILQRLDALEARIAALEAAAHSPPPRPSPSINRPAQAPSTSDRHCVVPPALFCSDASGGNE